MSGHTCNTRLLLNCFKDWAPLNLIKYTNCKRFHRKRHVISSPHRVFKKYMEVTANNEWSVQFLKTELVSVKHGAGVFFLCRVQSKNLCIIKVCSFSVYFVTYGHIWLVWYFMNGLMHIIWHGFIILIWCMYMYTIQWILHCQNQQYW